MNIIKGIPKLYKKKRTPKDSPKHQNCKCCKLGMIEPFHGRCKLPSTPPINGLSRIQHLNMLLVNFEFYNIRMYLYGRGENCKLHSSVSIFVVSPVYPKAIKLGKTSLKTNFTLETNTIHVPSPLNSLRIDKTLIRFLLDA